MKGGKRVGGAERESFVINLKGVVTVYVYCAGRIR
jgi:hypothetical protein